jgi:hypothetical protein
MDIESIFWLTIPLKRVKVHSGLTQKNLNTDTVIAKSLNILASYKEFEPINLRKYGPG